MSRVIQFVGLTLGVLLCLASPAFAQEHGTTFSSSFGAGLIILGAGYGIGKIGASEIPTDPMPIEACDIIILLKDKKEWTSASNRGRWSPGIPVS